MANKLVFDIETVGVDFDALDKTSQEYFKKFVESDEEFDELKDKLGFSPLTGEIVVIGLLNPDTKKGFILAQAPEAKNLPEEIEAGITLSIGSEKEILEKFWEIARSYHEFVSFNGRMFDVPFLMVRSAILGVRPTKNLMSNRYVSIQPESATHIDLLDQLTFYGAVRRKMNLHFWSKAFGIPSPKEGDLTGNEVKQYFKEGWYLEIAQYNLKDLKATATLYEKWNTYLRF